MFTMPKDAARLKQARAAVRENLIKLLADLNGHCPVGHLWAKYNQKYKTSPSKKSLGVNKLSDLFDIYHEDFEVQSDVVSWKRYKPTDKYGMAMPTPIKPIWGAGAQPVASGHSSGSNGAEFKTPKQNTPHNNQHPSFSQTSIDVSSSDTESSDSDSDVQFVGLEAGKGPPQTSSSEFLSLDVAQGPWNRPAASMVFNNSHMPEPLPHHVQKNFPTPAEVQQGIGNLGRGRTLEKLQAERMEPRPLLGDQFAMPTAALNFAGRAAVYPGCMAAMAMQRSSSGDRNRSRSSSISSDSHSIGQPGVGGPSPAVNARAPSAVGGVLPTFNSLPPNEATFPLSYPKLGVPPGIPREIRQVSVKPVPYQRGHLSKQQVESVAEDCIETLVETGEFVSPDRIIKLLLQRFNIRDLRDLNIPQLKFPFHVACINEHERLLSKVNAAVETFVLSRSICTIYDLEMSLSEYTSGENRFESLRLGPLQCLPVVYEKFKFPQNEKIPEISTADVLEALQQYLTEEKKWTERLDMQEVMLFFVNRYQVSTAYSLGIRIRSLPLAAQVLKKSHRDASATRRSVVERFKNLVLEEVSCAFNRVKGTILQTVVTDDGEYPELRLHYASMPANAVVLELMEKFHLLLAVDNPTTKAERRRHDRIRSSVQGFLTLMQEEPLAQALFHLAICTGRLDLQEAAMELLAPKPAPESQQDSGERSSAEQHKAKQPPSKSSLMEKVKKYIERCLAHGTLTLSNLERIEEKLLEDFGFPTFLAMGFGRFLHFMLYDPAPKTLLEEFGGVSMGGSGQSHGRAHMTEVLEFIRQCKAAALSQECDVEKALCQHFNVVEARLLGYGNLRHLLEAAEKPGKHHTKDYRILYETAFCGKTSQPIGGKRDVGILGHQSREAALACLQNCPLLEDMERWSHWSLVFEPQFGPLKDFLQKYGGVHTMHSDGGQKTIKTDIVALEAEPGRLLRLVTSTSPSEFQSAASSGDARATCGHLASLVTGNRGVEHTPLALLANHTRTALHMLHIAADVPGGPGQPTTAADPAVQFVLNCLLLLPLKLCLAVANQVFLEPLGQVVGNSRSKTLLLRACAAPPGSPPLLGGSPYPSRELARLGCLLGVQEWVRPLSDSFAFPAECVSVVLPSPQQPPTMRDEMLGEEGDEEVEEEESEEESEEEEESTTSFLSDEEEDEEEKDIETQGGEKKEKEEDADQDRKKKEELTVANMEEDSEEEESSEEEEAEEEGEEEEKEMQEGEDKGGKVKSTTPSKIKTKRAKTVPVDDSAITAEGQESSSEVESDEAEDEEEEEKEGEEDEEEEEEEEEELDPCLVIINQIRRDEFGVGVELNADGQRLMRVQQERLGRSLDRLSRDLYSKDTHFVLELVQNADDNAYPEELMAALESSSETDPCPAVRFIVSRDGVTVLNNETGFVERNVKALCDVGRSTKGKHKYGYIGQKGIGFKSVFRVTDRPEVHSNGFHLCFDVNSGPMGYILPHWCEDKEPQEDWMTKIVLPLKDTMIQEARSLAARFNDIHPSLLLFLHRLRSIHIDNKMEGAEQSMRRVDLGENIVEIHHGHGNTDRWLVVKKTLDASAISLQAKSGVEVESTEIALAFPLKGEWLAHHARAVPAKQPVFAFLPLRSYGFRFIVQGDFDVPSSREDVDRDSSWNQWLRNEIHTLFIEAFDIFRTHPEFEGLQSLWAYLQFVPLEDEILDFFKPVASHILQKMRAMACMPVASTNTTPGKKGGSSIQWKLPSQTIMVQDALVREVISPELLERHLGLHYIHRQATGMLNPLLTSSLGVQSLTSDHLLQVGRSLATAWGHSVGEEQIIQIAKWLACVYRSMDDFQENTTLLGTLRGMRVIPLSTGELVSLEEVTVFMLSTSDSSAPHRAPAGKRDPMSLLRQDLHLVHEGLTSTVDQEVNSQVSKLLHKLDIKRLTPQDMVHHHILPILRSQQWKTKEHAVLVSYLIYIKEERTRNPGLLNLEELKTVARVVTNHGLKNPATENVHFTPAYGVAVDLPRTFPGYDWTLLDGQYLPRSASKAEVVSWLEFFTALGVAPFLIVRKEEVVVKRDEMDKTPWGPLKELWPDSEETYLLQDWACDELQQLLSNNAAPNTLPQQMRALFRLLDTLWDAQYACFSAVQVKSGSSGSILKEGVPSSFALALQTRSWVPGLESAVVTSGDAVKIEEKEQLLAPSLLYKPDPEVKKLLAHTVNYLAVETSPTSTFTRFLRVKTTVEKQLVHDALVQWGKRDPGAPQEAAVFCSSLAHLKQVYIYLAQNLPPKEAQDLFHNNAVIFVPKKEVAGEGRDYRPQAGRMLGRDEVWWQDRSGLFLKYQTTLLDFHSPLAKRHAIEHLYKNLASDGIFTAARLQPGPEPVDFAELLTHIAASCSLKDEDVVTDVLSIYTRIGHYLSKTFDGDFDSLKQQEQKKRVVSQLKPEKVLATKKGAWVSAADKPLLGDDHELEKMFSDKEGAHFLLCEKPKRHVPRQTRHRQAGQDHSHINAEDTLAFLTLFEVPLLSEEVQKEEIPEMFIPCYSGQQYLHVIAPYVQRFLVAHYHEIQDAHHENKMAARLKELLFIKTKSLQVKYWLKSLPDVHEIRDERCVIVDKHFYFHEKYAESVTEVNKEVARFFSNGDSSCMKDLRHFLMDLEPLLSKGDDRGVQRLLKENDVLPLPPDVYLPWEVPKPTLPKPPTPPPPPPPPPKPAPAQSSAGAQGAEGEGLQLKAWPPTSNAERRNPDAPPITGQSKPMGPSIWPPPKAPDEVVKLRRDLPSNLVMAPHSPGSPAPADSESVKSPQPASPGGGSSHPHATGSGGSGSGGPGSGSGHPGSGSGHPGSGSRGERREGEDSAPREDEERGGGGRRTEAGVSGKRKSDPTDGEMSDSKRPVPDDRTAPTAAPGPQAVPDGSQPAVPMQHSEPGGDAPMATDEKAESRDGENRPRRPHSIARQGWPPYRLKSDHFQMPVWTQLASETEYEELGRAGDLKLPVTTQLSEASDRVEIGRWGELLVYDYLLQQKAQHQDIYEVIWINEAEESGKPYDFEVICTPGDEAYTLYIEVKATISSQKAVFEISSNEVKFAAEQGERYHIYRVFNAGVTDKVQLVRLTNVSHKMDNKEVRLLMFI